MVPCHPYSFLQGSLANGAGVMLHFRPQVKGSSYLTAKNESLATGGWSLEETVLLYKVIQFHSKRNKRFPAASHSTIIFNRLVASMKLNSSMRLLRTKTITQVQQKQNHMLKKSAVFNELVNLPF